MNKIIEEANVLGISLVGWVETAEKIGDHQYSHVTRVTAHGACVTVWDDLSWTILSNTGQLEGDEFPIKSPADIDNYVAEHYGGWAPAPIGMGLSEWQPIETAPKDGTLILASYQETEIHKAQFGIVKWYPNLGFWDDLTYNNDDDPTHWMPLPAPPEVKG